MVKAQCFKEKKQVDIKNPVYVILPNGRPAITGVCPNDGGKLFRFVGFDDPGIPAALRAKMSSPGGGKRKAKKGGSRRKSRRSARK